MIPVNQPLLDGNELNYVLECVNSGWISSEGPFVERFESGYARRLGRKHAIAVSSGTAALDAAVLALDLRPGDEVILPTFTIICCASAIIRGGGTPVLVDCHPDTWNMNAEHIRPCITPRTRAIMAVHTYGLAVDMNPLLALARQHNLRVIEDAAEAIGLKYQGRECGSLGDISCVSFYANKHITTGEGGMILTDDDQLAERCRRYRNLCFIPPRRFVHEELGWNYRMCNLQAALGLAQLERLDCHIERKRAMGRRYHELLADVCGVQLPLQRTADGENIYWVFGLVLDNRVPFDAEEAMRRLAARQIGTRPFFWPMHEQPVFKQMESFRNTRYPVAERLARRGFYIPSGLGLGDAEIASVAASVIAILR